MLGAENLSCFRLGMEVYLHCFVDLSCDGRASRILAPLAADSGI